MIMDEARLYIANVRWQFAKTMPQWPHEYTVRAWLPNLEHEFLAFVELIREKGEIKPWPREPPILATTIPISRSMAGSTGRWALRWRRRRSSIAPVPDARSVAQVNRDERHRGRSREHQYASTSQRPTGAMLCMLARVRAGRNVEEGATTWNHSR